MATSVHDLELPEVAILGLERADMLAMAKEARSRHWLARTPLGYTVTRHADAVGILRDRRFHSALALLPQLAGVDDPAFLARRRRPSILSMEGDEHARVRRLVAPAFSPKAADRLRPTMREVVSRLVSAVEPEGRCELVADVCEPYPIPIICELLGAPKEDWKRFSAWATDIFRIFNNDVRNDLPLIMAAQDELDEYVRDMVAERRTSPSNDLLSALIAAEEAGDRLSTDELVMLAEAVLMAGTDTTRNQLACTVALYAGDPEGWARLATEPEIVPGAVEESMRHLGAVRGTARFASEDIVYRDVLFPAGTLVGANLAVANLDPEAFPDPDAFDVTRPATPQHLGFGSGIHHCLGAALARAELQEALPILARAMPDLRLDGPIEWKPETVGIWGPARLPLRFRSTASAG
jgi:cytochrome P450